MRQVQEVMQDPDFVPVDMQELMDEGVLMAANEQFFWRLGLALTWTAEKDGSGAWLYKRDLHVREWRKDGEWIGERIEAATDDEIANDRRRRFASWLQRRLDGFKVL